VLTRHAIQVRDRIGELENRLVRGTAQTEQRLGLVGTGVMSPGAFVVGSVTGQFSSGSTRRRDPLCGSAIEVLVERFERCFDAVKSFLNAV
jgi:hypothetical protein